MNNNLETAVCNIKETYKAINSMVAKHDSQTPEEVTLDMAEMLVGFLKSCNTTSKLLKKQSSTAQISYIDKVMNQVKSTLVQLIAPHAFENSSVPIIIIEKCGD